uniref:Uncharacterized protein n=1 Tax=Sipha flava TaxID=143950 RepID=A0A2S2R8F4_9HEMI
MRARSGAVFFGSPLVVGDAGRIIVYDPLTPVSPRRRLPSHRALVPRVATAHFITITCRTVRAVQACRRPCSAYRQFSIQHRAPSGFLTYVEQRVLDPKLKIKPRTSDWTPRRTFAGCNDCTSLQV